jgi:hypothetical protein
MGQFRDRMDEELRIRGYGTSTRECDVRCVRNSSATSCGPPISSPSSTSASTNCI